VVDRREVKLGIGRPCGSDHCQLEQHENRGGAQTKEALHAAQRCETAASARSAKNAL
jgi:hypothetical protein